VLLGIMRALGETMVVWMASGNAAQIPEPWFNYFAPIRTLTATIAGDMGEADHVTGSARYHVLFAMATGAACLLPGSAAAQAVADPILVGRAMLGDSVLTSGMVVLHHLGPVTQGEIDSVAVAPDGSFVLRLPRVPDPATEEMYFASVRHDGVMYFGNGITAAVDLDSLYVINAYDTLVAPAEGMPVALEARSVFFEQAGAEWAVTDVFQLHNELDRTLVPRSGGRVWSYPLPVGARDVAAEGEMSGDVVGYEGGQIVFRAALPPGERLFVIRYYLDSLEVTLPTPGETAMMDVLVREPAPTMEIEGLGQDESIQIDATTTYRRFAGQNVVVPEVRVRLVEEVPPPPVEWIAAILALVLAGGALLAFRSGRRPAESAGVDGSGSGSGVGGRQALLLELARLDEAYEQEKAPSDSRTKEYRRRRAELMERLRSQG